MRPLKYTAFLLAGTVLFSACRKDKDDDPAPGGSQPPLEQELITTVTMTFSAQGGGTDRVWTWRDLDGDGGNDPVITVEPLDTNTTYIVSITLLDEAQDPPEDITEEIEEEDEEHQFFFLVDGADLDISYADADANGSPVGLLNNAVTGNVSTGTLTVILRHEPEKGAAGVSDGDITNAGGETDVEVLFPTTIAE